MDTLQEQLCAWENLRLACDKAARGKRGRGATAAFEYDLADGRAGPRPRLLAGQIHNPPADWEASPPRALL